MSILRRKTKMSREWTVEKLDYYLRKFTPDELVDCLKSAILVIVGDNDKALKDITHSIVTYVQVREIIAGKEKLEDYKEPHRSELKKEIEKLNPKRKLYKLEP
jgi:hypothetical protein